MNRTVQGGAQLHHQEAALPGSRTERLSPSAILLLLYVTLVPIAIVPGAYGGEFLGVSDLLCPLALVLALFSRQRVTALHIAAASFVSLVFLSFIFRFEWTAPEFLKVYRLAGIFSPLLLLGSVAPGMSPRLLRLAATAAFVGAMSAVIIGVVMHEFGLTYGQKWESQTLWVQGMALIPRAAGMTGNTADYGHILAIAFLIGWFFAAHISIVPPIVIRAGALTIFLYALVASSSRAAILDATSALGFAFVMALLRRDKNALTLSLTGLGLFVAAAFLTLTASIFSPDIAASLSRVNPTYSGVDQFVDGERLGTWGVVSGALFNDALWGIGYKRSEEFFSAPIDNSYLKVLVELGYLAFVMYILVWVLLYRAASQKGALSRDVSIYCQAITVGCVAHGLTVDIHTMWATTPALFAFLSLVICANRRV